VFDDHFITGHGSGLKVVAPLAGHRWEVAVQGGEESMAQHDVAMGNDDAASAAREWLLMYNRGDVEATRHLREWMASALVPPIEGVDPHIGA
jgi:predicted RecB family nuclease